VVTPTLLRSHHPLKAAERTEEQRKNLVFEQIQMPVLQTQQVGDAVVVDFEVRHFEQERPIWYLDNRWSKRSFDYALSVTVRLISEAASTGYHSTDTDKCKLKKKYVTG